VRLAVTGAGGGLGRAFLDLAPQHHDLAALTHEDLDVGDHDAVMRQIPLTKPDAILNFAAVTNVDDCESDPDRAYRDNAIGPQNLALAARACDATLLHVSTDYVFDGEKGLPYDELDTPNPQSVYGRSKLAGENFVRELVPEHFVVRTAFVFGGGTDYCSRALRRLEAGEKAGGIGDRTGSPTYVRHLAARVLPLLLTGKFGTYHLAGAEATTWFDVLRRAKAIGGLEGEVFEQRVDDLGLAAPRPRNSSLTSLFAGEVGLPPMPSLDDALRELLAAQG
jgi:dTDP-4-dehydrorhamnose reductase